MKLAQRMTLYSTGLLLLILIVVNIGIYLVFQQNLMEGEQNRTLEQARTMTEAVSSQPDQNPASFLESYVSGDSMIRVISPEGSSLLTVTTQNTELATIPVTDPQPGREETRVFEFAGSSYAAAQVPLLWEEGAVVTLEVTEPMPMYEETLQILRFVLILATAVIVLPSFLAARSLSRFVLRPVQALVATMKQIEEQGTFKKIEPDTKRKDELADMGRTFNHMIDLLRENYEKQQQFVSDASHELKTPLTVIDSYAQLLKRRGRDKPEVVDEAVEAISSEAQRMKEMTNQMLALASGENRAVEKEPVRPGPVFADTARQLSVAYSRPVHVDADETAVIKGNELQLKQLAYLLIENALKYSSEDVSVSVKRGADGVTCTVTDKGIGIAEEDLPYIFDRFYRVDKARTRASGGTGLGLSIAKEITESHEGRIHVESKLEQGTTFTVLFPEEEEA
ncbi:sensor histidine kinase [Alkalicoccus luteus]|uniref:Signal transduction histidine-protein kinase ArlS n=1 Tax=Alkalicoccus luteus TaxID=1237094 RepID=A0A969PU96_9BACI|nr:ATP-binding protein [Alkalicoccus luteus]NJP38506.1 HAMP domain-containing histidine kinase [Alkalicoccus luteus]